MDIENNIGGNSVWIKDFQHDIRLNGTNYLLITLIVALIGYYIKWKLSTKHYDQLAAKIPYLPNHSRLPLVGHLHHLLGDQEHILNTIIATSKEVSPSKLQIGPYIVFIISKPEDVKIIFNSPHCVNRSRFYEIGVSIVGEGIGISSGTRWKKHRKLINPSFSQRKLENNIPIFNEKVKEFVKILEMQRGTFDFTEKVSQCTLATITETTMGIKINQMESNNEFYEKLERVVKLAVYRGLNILLYPDPIFHLTPTYREVRKLQKYLRDYTLDIINKRKEMRKNNPEKLKGSMFLDDLLDINEETNDLSYKDIMDEVNTFLAGGNDTNATVASFVILSLGMYPNIQQKVYEEVMDILGPEKEVEPEDLQKFSYLECVLKETMRIFTLAPVISRAVDADVQLSTCTLPKGSEILVPIIGIHRSPENFLDPLKFDPSRFLPEECAKRHPYSFIPFTSGLRMCIGYKYAYMFLKTLVANIVRTFEIETDIKSIEDLKFEFNLVLKSKNGCPIRLKPRKSI